MAIIKKFRIKSFKNNIPDIEFEDISLSYGNRLILDKINFKISKFKQRGILSIKYQHDEHENKLVIRI